MTIADILRMSLAERKEKYGVEGIGTITIDGVEFSNYKAFTFIEEISYVEEPDRSGDGTMSNLDTIPTFKTPHLKIDFSILSIDDYRVLMGLEDLRREHTVVCYDIVKNKMVSHQMYFAPAEMPKLVAIANALNNVDYVEVLGVQDYVVEMIGTNRTNKRISIIYKLNPPSSVDWQYGVTTVVSYADGVSRKVGDNANVNVDNVQTAIQSITFDNTYTFNGWNTEKNGSGTSYTNGNAYYFYGSTTLYAQWR